MLLLLKKALLSCYSLNIFATIYTLWRYDDWAVSIYLSVALSTYAALLSIIVPGFSNEKLLFRKTNTKTPEIFLHQTKQPLEAKIWRFWVSTKRKFVSIHITQWILLETYTGFLPTNYLDTPDVLMMMRWNEKYISSKMEPGMFLLTQSQLLLLIMIKCITKAHFYFDFVSTHQ